MTPAGAYRHFVMLERQVRNADGGGGYREQWKEFDEAFVSVQPLSSRERAQAMKVSAEITHRVRLRWRSDMPKQLRFQLGTRTLTQVGPWTNVDERNREIELLCAEAVPVEATS